MRYVVGFFKATTYLTWAVLLAVTVAAAVTGSWWLALLGTGVIGWRLGLRYLVRRNQAEVERWQARGAGGPPTDSS